MTEAELTRIVGALRGRQRQVYEIIRAGGPITQRAIHEARAEVRDGQPDRLHPAAGRRRADPGGG